MNAHANAHVYTTTHPLMQHTNMHVYLCTHTQHYVCTQDGFFPLYVASQNSHDRIVEMLLQAGATVDLQNKVENGYYLFFCHLTL